MTLKMIFIGYIGIGLLLQTIALAKDIIVRYVFHWNTLTVEVTGLKRQILIRAIEVLIWPIEIFVTIRLFYLVKHDPEETARMVMDGMEFWSKTDED